MTVPALKSEPLTIDLRITMDGPDADFLELAAKATGMTRDKLLQESIAAGLRSLLRRIKSSLDQPRRQHA